MESVHQRLTRRLKDATAEFQDLLREHAREAKAEACADAEAKYRQDVSRQLAEQRIELAAAGHGVESALRQELEAATRLADAVRAEGQRRLEEARAQAQRSLEEARTAAQQQVQEVRAEAQRGVEEARAALAAAQQEVGSKVRAECEKEAARARAEAEQEATRARAECSAAREESQKLRVALQREQAAAAAMSANAARDVERAQADAQRVREEAELRRRKEAEATATQLATLRRDSEQLRAQLQEEQARTQAAMKERQHALEAARETEGRALEAARETEGRALPVAATAATSPHGDGSQATPLVAERSHTGSQTTGSDAAACGLAAAAEAEAASTLLRVQLEAKSEELALVQVHAEEDRHERRQLAALLEEARMEAGEMRERVAHADTQAKVLKTEVAELAQREQGALAELRIARQALDAKDQAILTLQARADDLTEKLTRLRALYQALLLQLQEPAEEEEFEVISPHELA